jgi:uncharacterized NAD(P)/FAD-binding protein YdhS
MNTIAKVHAGGPVQAGSDPARRVAIIGGGFSGAVVAVQMARHATTRIEIDLIEPRPVLGGGVAYSATDPSHRINVPASRMTVFAEEPDQFDRWLRATDVLRSDPAALWAPALAFPQRAVFGEYLAERVAEAACLPGVTLRHHAARAEDVIARPRGFTVRLDTGAVVDANCLVLAVSHPPPAVPGALRDVLAAGAPVIADPWAAGALDRIGLDADVLIVGTGLSMADVVATLDRRGHRGQVRAISRRGLLSRGHVFLGDTKWCFAETVTPPRTARGLVRLVRREVANAAAAGLPWQLVFDDVRLHGGRLWTALPEAEQRRIVRHIRPYWDVHRFRVAPQIEAAIGRMRATGQFHAEAASLQGATWDGHRIGLRLRPRQGDGATEVVRTADVVVNTTGPAHGTALTGNKALAALLRQGLLRPDRVGLGIDVDVRSRAVGIGETARADLLVAGPLARGRFGELMGLPQVSEHALAVALTALEALENTAVNTACAAAKEAE